MIREVTAGRPVGRRFRSRISGIIVEWCFKTDGEGRGNLVLETKPGQRIQAPDHEGALAADPNELVTVTE